MRGEEQVKYSTLFKLMRLIWKVCLTAAACLLVTCVFYFGTTVSFFGVSDSSNFIDCIKWAIGGILTFIGAMFSRYWQRRMKKTSGKITTLADYCLIYEICDMARESYKYFLDYRCKKIRYRGRGFACQRFSDFMEDNRKQLMWTVTGFGGVGKSRYVFHNALKYSKRVFSNWNIIWIDESVLENMEGIIDYGVTGKLLLIFDYAENYTDKIFEFINKIHNANSCLIRVFFLCRYECLAKEIKHVDKLEALQQKLERLGVENFDDFLRLEEKLEYCDYTGMLDDLETLFRNYKKIRRKDGLLSDTDKENIISIIKAPENNMDSPLFLLLYGDAYLNANSKREFENKKLDPPNVIRTYFVRQKERWLPIKNETKKDALCLRALATVLGQFYFNRKEYGDCRDKYIQNIKNLFNNDKASQRIFLATLCERDSTNSDLITPYMPDKLGGLFVIWCFDIFLNDDDEKQEWFDLFSSEDCSEKFFIFLDRLWEEWFHYEKTIEFIVAYSGYLSSYTDEVEKQQKFLLSKELITRIDKWLIAILRKKQDLATLSVLNKCVPVVRKLACAFDDCSLKSDYSSLCEKIAKEFDNCNEYALANNYKEKSETFDMVKEPADYTPKEELV